jgi:Fe-S-cluster containining protein
MLTLTDEQKRAFRAAVLSATGRADVREAVRNVYLDVTAAVQERKPRCATSGDCCHFDRFGHRLFVTTIEVALFVEQLPLVQSSLPAGGRLRLFAAAPQPTDAPDGAGCPFQVGGLCSVHAIRPFGCRIFFCDPTATEWQRRQYERFHARLRRLHDELGVEYAYVEWREALAAVGLTGRGTPPSPVDTGDKRL